MPCRSDYMAPDHREIRLQRTAQLLVWLLPQIGQQVQPHQHKAAADQYCKDGQVVLDLCAALKSMSPHAINEIVYNARDPMSRRLADWWDEHQEADRRRLEVEAGHERLRLLSQDVLRDLQLMEEAHPKHDGALHALDDALHICSELNLFHGVKLDRFLAGSTITPRTGAIRIWAIVEFTRRNGWPDRFKIV